MVNTTISAQAPGTGTPVSVPEDVLNRVKRASQLLETELAGVGKTFPIDIRWQLLSQPDHSLGLQLNLTSQGAGIKEYPLPLESFRDDESILRTLRTPIWFFSRTLSDVVKWDLERIKRGLDDLSANLGE